MCTRQAGSLSTSLIVGTTATKHILRAQVANTIVLLEGEPMKINEADRPTISRLKGIRINMATLPWETLYIIQDGITVELQARESCVLQVLSEKEINME